MKAKFFLLGLCALGLAACSLDEVSQVNDTNAVTFKATTATRATAVTTNNLTEFSVWAWNDGNEFMDDVIATKSGSSFVTSPLYFWPTGTVDFYALVPATTVTAWESVEGVMTEYAYLGGELDPDHELTEDGTPWVYTGNVAKAQINNGKIVIDTYVPSHADEQIDLCYAVTKDQSSGSVPMNFRHALSQVAFKVTNSNPEFVVDIQEISLCSVYKEGTLTITDTTCTNLPTADLGIDEGLAQGTWVVNETDEYEEQLKGRFVPGITPTVLTGTADGTVDITTDPLMLIPQEVVGWDVYTGQYDEQLGSYIRILCNVQESGSQLWPNTVEEEYEGDEDSPVKMVGETEYAEIAVPIPDVVWEQGYKYTYTIIFGEGIGYYPPDDPNTELDGTPILVPISFTVTVDEFQDAVATEEGQYDVSTNTDVIVTNKADLVAAFNRGLSPIEIAADITLDGCLWLQEGTIDITIDEGCTLTIENDHETTGSSWAAFYVTGGTLNLYGDGEIAYVSDYGLSDSFYAIWIRGSDDAVANIYGCTIQGYPDCVYAQGGYAYIYGGTFYGTGTYKDEYWLLNCYDSYYTAGTTNIYVYGGTYKSFDPSNNVCEGDGTNFVVDGYGVVTSVDEDGNTWYTVVKTTVATPADLYAAVDAGASEITLDADVTLESHDLFFYDDCELNLNGHTLTGVDVADDEDCSGANSVVFVYGGTLTVNGPGTITTEGSGKGADGTGTGSGDTSCFWLNGGELIINGGTYNGGSWKDTAGEEYTDSSATVYVQSGFAYIYDGTFTCGVAAAFKSDGWKTTEGYTESIINIYDSARKTDPKTGWAYVYGGTYRNFDPGNNPCEGANTNFCAEGYASDNGVVDADGNTWFTVAATN